jgi:hypothetical protein
MPGNFRACVYSIDGVMVILACDVLYSGDGRMAVTIICNVDMKVCGLESKNVNSNALSRYWYENMKLQARKLLHICIRENWTN